MPAKGEQLLTPDEVAELEETIKDANLTCDRLKERFGVKLLAQLPFGMLEEVLQWIEDNAKHQDNT